VYCYLKRFIVKIQIHVARSGTHICNSGDTLRRLMIMAEAIDGDVDDCNNVNE